LFVVVVLVAGGGVGPPASGVMVSVSRGIETEVALIALSRSSRARPRSVPDAFAGDASGEIGPE
jgi:hypothetical protein